MPLRVAACCDLTGSEHHAGDERVCSLAVAVPASLPRQRAVQARARPLRHSTPGHSLASGLMSPSTDSKVERPPALSSSHVRVQVAPAPPLAPSLCSDRQRPRLAHYSSLIEISITRFVTTVSRSPRYQFHTHLPLIPSETRDPAMGMHIPALTTARPRIVVALFALMTMKTRRAGGKRTPRCFCWRLTSQFTH